MTASLRAGFVVVIEIGKLVCSTYDTEFIATFLRPEFIRINSGLEDVKVTAPRPSSQ